MTFAAGWPGGCEALRAEDAALKRTATRATAVRDILDAMTWSSLIGNLRRRAAMIFALCALAGAFLWRAPFAGIAGADAKCALTPNGCG